MVWQNLKLRESRIFERIGIHRDNYSTQQGYWFAQSAALYTYIGMAVAFSYAVLYYFIGAMQASFALGALSVVLIATTPLHKRGRSVLLARFNLAATSLGLGAVVAHTGGINSSSACWLLGVTPGITALLFRRPKEIIQLTLLTIMLYCIIFGLEMNGYPVQQLGYPVGSIFERTYTFMHYTFFSLFIAMALSIFAITQKSLYDSLKLNKEKLEKTTTDIQAIFQSIDQAVFLVNAELVISNERSARFQEILGPGVVSLLTILERCRLSKDSQNQAVEAAKTCLGNDALNFSVNDHLLPREVLYQKTNSSSEQTLSIHWSPVFSGDVVRDLLVEIRDITQWTEAKAKQRQANERNSLLLSLMQTDPSQLPYVVRNMEALGQKIAELSRDASVDAALFKAIVHTIKGNARSLRLLAIAETCHELETILVTLSPWSLLRDDVENLIKILLSHMQDYQKIYQGTMAKYQLREGSLELDSQLAQQMIESLESGSGGSELAKRLKGLLPLSLGRLVDGLKADLSDLSQELNKAEPVVLVNDRGFTLSEAARPILANILGHVLRNALDHGLEDRITRLKRGKDEQGQIRLKATIGGGICQLSIQDDGQGLNLVRIREKAATEGLPYANDEQLARLICLDDFSTSDKLTMISGRGVGMAAVVRELSRMRGQLSIQFAGEELDGYRPFTLVLSWPEQMKDSHPADSTAA